MNTTFEAFRQQRLTEGFDEVLEREWAPLTVLDTHSHPFAANALVARGEMWLTVGEHTRHPNPIVDHHYRSARRLVGRPGTH
ncbi:MAG: hypothetical protein U1E02_25720 [Hydrogenophaga sp.]|nr:hypothetical protein [Hydrogenophaga sp.]